jgi:hypothetical protein
MLGLAIVAVILVVSSLFWWSSGPRFQGAHRVSRPDMTNPAVQMRMHSDSTHANIGSL